jgi:hypothetical protein
MPSRGDETYLNTNPHPSNCSCQKCIHNRKREEYSFPAEFECPACGNFSVWKNDEKQEYACMHPTCKFSGKTLEEIAEKKSKSDKKLEGLWHNEENHKG